MEAMRKKFTKGIKGIWADAASVWWSLTWRHFVLLFSIYFIGGLLSGIYESCVDPIYCEREKLSVAWIFFLIFFTQIIAIKWLLNNQIASTKRMLLHLFRMAETEAAKMEKEGMA